MKNFSKIQFLVLQYTSQRCPQKGGVLVDIFKSGYFEKLQIDFSKNIAIVPSNNDNKR